MARPKRPVDRRLLSRVSRLYYLEDCTQREIAERFRISRPTISRLLKRAREEGIVQISVNAGEGHYELERRLEVQYGLQEALIVDFDPAYSRPEMLKRALGRAAAEYFQRTLQEGDRIGVSWSATMQMMMQALQPVHAKDIRIVQTLGSVNPSTGTDALAAELSHSLARHVGGAYTMLPAPGIVDDSNTRAVLMADSNLQAALALFSQLTVAYTGISALETNLVFRRLGGFIDDDIYRSIRDAGAVGDIGLRFFDRDGRPVRTVLDDRVIGITLDELRQVPRAVGIAGGQQKTGAIATALRGGLVNVLITDLSTARRLVER